ncbi:MAG: sulfatase [bacterium]|nr:sulfatase [bacterium]
MGKPKRDHRAESHSRAPLPLIAGGIGLVAVVLVVWWVWSRTPADPADSVTRSGEGVASTTGTGAAPIVDPDANVVIFLIDTLRADRLGAYGYPQATSPHMDALATRGVVFEQCTAPAPWTLPSVVSLLTSTFVCEHGVIVDRQKIRDEMEPLAARLKRAGYTTAAFYANSYAGPMTGLDRGYDHHQSVRAADGDTVGPWLDQVGSGRFFLYVHNIEPHNPYAAPDRHVRRFGQVGTETKRMVQERMLGYRKLTRVDFAAGQNVGTTDNTAAQEETMGAIAALREDIDVLYNAAVRQADERVGSVIQALKQRGQWENTLFILVSDHGEEMGDHGGWQHDQSVYEEMVHVPLIVRFPKSRFAGRRVEQVASLVDVAPTILAFIGRDDLTSGFRGRNLLPRIQTREAPGADEPAVTSMRINRKKFFAPYRRTRGEINVVVRQDSWKGIWNAEVPGFELYNLAADPTEQSDLAGSQATIAASLRDFAQQWLQTCGIPSDDVAPGGLEGLDAETLENLRSLGYIE